MFPSVLPLNIVPVTSQQDPVRVRPEIPPVVPVQATSSDSTINMRQRDPEEAAQVLRDEQRRQQQGRAPRDAEQPAALIVEPGDALNADSTVPVVPIMSDPLRQGLWVDIRI